MDNNKEDKEEFRVTEEQLMQAIITMRIGEHAVATDTTAFDALGRCLN